MRYLHVTDTYATSKKIVVSVMANSWQLIKNMCLKNNIIQL